MKSLKVFFVIVFLSIVGVGVSEAAKSLYVAKLMAGGFGWGGATLVISCPGASPKSNCPPPNKVVINILAKSYTVGVKRVSVKPADGSWSVVLCDAATRSMPCTYDEDGLLVLDIEDLNDLLIAGGITGRNFKAALDEGLLTIVYDYVNDGEAVGAFVRTM